MTRPGPVNRSDLDDFLRAHGEWAEADGTLVRSASAPSFPAAIDWVGAVAVIAEQVDHHPDIDIRWRTVTFRLSTHDVGAITALDLDLAARIDGVLSPRP